MNIYDIADTWNNATEVFNGIKLNVTDTASHADSKLLDLQVGGVSRFRVDKGGKATVTDQLSITSSSVAGTANIIVAAGNIKVQSSLNVLGTISIGSGWGTLSASNNGPAIFTQPSNSSNRGLVLRPAVGMSVDIENGANPQTFRIYNTYTDASNYERGCIKWVSNTLRISTEAAGTGTGRGVIITSSGSAEVAIQRAGTEMLSTGSAGMRAAAGKSIYAGNSSCDLGLDGTSFEWRNLFLQGYQAMREVAASPSGVANKAIIYAEDNGSGKTRLMVKFGSGAAQQIAIEP